MAAVFSVVFKGVLGFYGLVASWCCVTVS